MKKDRNIINNYLRDNIKQEFLPDKLIQKIHQDIFSNTKYEYRTKNNFLRCISIIYFKQVNEHFGLEGYVPTGSSYWRTAFGGDYHKKIIKPLIDLEIIQTWDFGFRSYPNLKILKGKEPESVGIRYRINPALTIDEKYSTIDYIIKNNSSVLIAEEIIKNEGVEMEFEPLPTNNLFISIDKKKASDWVDENADKICEQFLNTNIVLELPENTIIPFHYHIDGNSFNTRYLTIKKAKFEALIQGKQLFFYKDNFYMANIEAFTKYRITSLRYHYKHEISKIGILPLILRRSGKTLRITSFLTNFPSKILQFININNQTVVQFDLRTSQFLIFANLLNIYISEGDKELLRIFKKSQTRTFLRRLIKILDAYKNMLPQGAVDITNPIPSQNSVSDVIRFINDVFFDDFYTNIQKKFTFSDRGLAKLLLFKLLFKRNTKSDELISKLGTATFIRTVS